MKRFVGIRLLAAAVAVLMVGGLLAGCGKGTTAASIKSRGVLRAGVKQDVPGFGYLNPDSNQYEGFEIDIARRIAEEFIGDGSKVEFTAVTPKTRMGLLDGDQLDLVIATFTVTEERKQQANFSPIYYTDGIQLLVKNSSGINGLADLQGKTVGVSQGATTPGRLAEKGAEIGVTMEFAEFPDYPSIMAALAADRVDAFSVDGAILTGYQLQDPENLTVLPTLYSQEPYGIATKKANTALAESIAKIINDMEQSGELQALRDKWGLTGTQ